MKEKISMGLGVIMGFVSYFMGGLDTLLSVFATILIVDTATGMLKAWNNGNYESKEFRKGFIKKSGYLLGIIMAVQIDKLIGDNGALRSAVLTFFIANESFSILENLGEMGVHFPKVFSNAIKSLNGEEKENSEGDSVE